MPGGRGGGASSDSDRPLSGCQGLQRITTSSYLRTVRERCPDNDTNIPDAVRAPGRPMRAGPSGPWGVQPHGGQSPPDEAGNLRSADSHSLESLRG